MAATSQPVVLALLLCFENSPLKPQIKELESAMNSLGWKAYIAELSTIGSHTANINLREAIGSFKESVSSPDDQLVVYYGGNAYSPDNTASLPSKSFYGAPKEDWVWHAVTEEWQCTFHTPSANPKDHLESLLLGLANDILFIFHVPFALSKTEYFQAGVIPLPETRPNRNIQLLLLGKEQFSALTPQTCRGCAVTPGAKTNIAIKAPVGPDPFTTPGGFKKKGKKAEPQQTKDLAVELSQLADRDGGVSVGELGQVINGLSDRHLTSVMTVSGWKMGLVLKSLVK